VFQADWKHISREEAPDLPGHDKERFRWSGDCLFRDSPDATIEVCLCKTRMDVLPGETHLIKTIGNRELVNGISSPLLLYRLVSVSGHTALEEQDGYKSYGELTPKYTLDGTEALSTLQVFGYKGWVVVRFIGTMQASQSAVDMLNWPRSMDVPHTYDGIVTGRYA